MRMIYGALGPTDAAPCGTREAAQAETRAVSRMMAAMGDCPWESDALRSLPGTRGLCTLAVQAACELPAPSGSSTLLPRSGGLTIAADVRLDNRAELCAALAIGPDERQALDDAGLVLRAYGQWGTTCAEHLLGDFAFALWDEAAGRLFCARDFVGVRPFYYHHAPSTGRFVCAGGLPAMVAHPAVPGSLNLAYVRAYLQPLVGQFQHPEQTFYQEILKLPPAHCLTVAREGLHRWAYWQPDQVPQRRHADERSYVEELRALMGLAVGCRIQSPYPVGAHVSGGLDSSGVAALAHRDLQTRGRGITGFSWSPPPPACLAELSPDDERLMVETVREAEGFPVRYTTLTVDQVAAQISLDITVRPAVTLQWELAASTDAASLGIRTLLSGWGGDELVAFNGRGYLADLLRRGRWITLRRELTLRSRRQGGSVWRSLIGSGLLPFLPTAIVRRLRLGGTHSLLPLPAWLRPDFATVLTSVKPLASSDLRERPGVRRNQIANLQHGHLSYRMESWAGHGATLGMTYVFPLLDRRLAEFALGIPDDLFFRDGWPRHIYRMAMAGTLPDHVRWQQAKGNPAMAWAGQQVWDEATASVRAALLARADNPLVDVAKLVAAWEAAEIAAVTGGSPNDRPAPVRPRALTRHTTRLAFAAFGRRGWSQRQSHAPQGAEPRTTRPG